MLLECVKREDLSLLSSSVIEEKFWLQFPRRDRKIKNQDLDMSDLTVERALGVHWNIENVYLDFKIQLKDKPQKQSGTLTLNLKYMTVMILKFVITWQ